MPLGKRAGNQIKSVCEKSLVYVRVLDHESEWQAFRYFNENAYPSYVRSKVYSCWRRFSLIFSFYENMQTIKINDTRKFLAWLNEHASELRTVDKTFAKELIYESVGYVSNFYMILFMIKSFLDIWSRTGAILIDPRARILGFNKARIDGEELAGGRFISWLSQSVHQTPGIQKLICLVRDNTKTWITEVVNFRDRVLHFGEIMGIRPLRSIIYDEPKNKYMETDLLQASMPDGTSVIDYAKDKIVRLNSFIIDFIKLLPNIDSGLLSLEPLST